MGRACQSSGYSDPTAFDQIRSELIASHEDSPDWETDRERTEPTKASLYVTERRTFFIVEQFFSIDGRLAKSTKPVSPEQARDWCRACGLDERILDRYLGNSVQSNPAPESVSLLNQHWGTDGVTEHIAS